MFLLFLLVTLLPILVATNNYIRLLSMAVITIPFAVVEIS